MPKWTDWQCIYNDNWTMEFKNIVRKRLPCSTSVIDDTMLDVRQELAINLSTLNEAPHSINAYLRIAFRNTLEDYLRKKHGYPRPPEWIKRLGATYERIYKLLCLENRTVNDVHASMSSLYKHSRDFIENIISEVRAGVINCGSWRETVSMDDSLNGNEMESSEYLGGTSLPPDVILQNMNSSALFKAILGDAQMLSNSLHSNNLKVVFESLQKKPLQDDECLLLRMIYTDGHTVSSAARLLGMADKKARSQLNVTLKRLRNILQTSGITDI